MNKKLLIAVTATLLIICLGLFLYKPWKAPVAPGQANNPGDPAGNEQHGTLDPFIRHHYGMDPAIFELRQKCLPRKIWDTGGPPNHENETAYLKDAVKKDPDNEDLLYLLGWNLFLTENYEEAEGVVGKILASKPDSERGLELKSFINYCKAEYTAACENSGKALEKYPKNAVINYINGASWFFGTNNPGKAIPMLQKSVDLAPDDPLAYGALGQCYFAMETPEGTRKGMQIFKNAIEKFPNHQMTFVMVAEDYLLTTGDLKRTIELTNKVIELNPKDYQAYLLKGCLYMDMGKYKQAHKAFLAGEKSNIPYKFQSEIQEKLGESSYALKETENARKYFLKAISIEKRTKSTSRYRAESYIGLARISMDAGNLAEAKKYLDEAHRAYPNHEEFVYAMTDWYILNNEIEKAKSYLHNGISQNSEAVFLQRDEIDYLEAKIAYAEQGDDKGASGVLEAISKAKGYNKALMARRFQSDPFFSKLQKNSDFQTKIAQVINEEESKNGAIPSIDNN